MERTIKKQKELQAQYKQLFTDIEKIWFVHDPMGIAYVDHEFVEDNCDEYAPEVGTILPRLETAESADDVADIVYEEFMRWFGDDGDVGSKADYQALSGEIWDVWVRVKKDGAL